MSSVRLTPPPQRRVSALYLFAGLAVAAALVAVAAAAPRPIMINVDGTPRRVSANASIGEIDPEMFASRPGNLLALSGSVIETAGGDPVTVLRNGRRVPDDRRLYEGDSITTLPGADITERAITETRTVPFSTRIVGSGPISEVATQGVDGIRQITRGEKSRIVSSSFMARETVDQVVVRTMPRPGAKLVALTFDDGPWPGQTERVLDVLKANDVQATFFVVGGRVAKRADIVRREVAERHMVGNHSLNHKLLTRLSPSDIHVQIQHGADRIAQIPGTDWRWFRPPYGAMDGESWREARKLRARVVLWTVDSQDWRRPGAHRIARNVVSATKPGSIILMHDGGGDRSQTIAALPEIITTLKGQGYVFVTVEDLVAAR